MLTVEQLKRFSNQCLKLRQILQNGMRCNDAEYSVIKTHIETLITDLEKQIENDTSANLGNPQTEMSSIS